MVVIMIADLMAAGLQSGCAPLSNAATPLMCVHDMEVPDIILNSVCLLSFERPVGPIESVQAARMLKPGAIMSGLRISGDMELGPLLEKEATTGAGLSPNLVP